MDEIEITVINWKEYNPRKDRAHHHWFRMEDSLFSDPQFGDFSAEELLAFVYFLATTCEKQGKPWPLKLKHVSRSARISENSVLSSFDKLVRLGILGGNHTVTTRIPTGITTEQNSTLQYITEQKKMASNGNAVTPPAAHKKLLSYPEFITAEWVAEQFGEFDEVLKVYNDTDWIWKELAKMAIWMECNRHKLSKTRKGLRQRVMSWLHRGWDQYAKNLPSKPARHVIDHDALWDKK